MTETKGREDWHYKNTIGDTRCMTKAITTCPARDLPPPPPREQPPREPVHVQAFQQKVSPATRRQTKTAVNDPARPNPRSPPGSKRIDIDRLALFVKRLFCTVSVSNNSPLARTPFEDNLIDWSKRLGISNALNLEQRLRLMCVLIEQP